MTAKAKDSWKKVGMALARCQGRPDKEYQNSGMAPMMWDEDAAWSCLCRARALRARALRARDRRKGRKP